MKRIFFDGLGYLRIGWMVAAFVGGIVALIVLVGIGITASNGVQCERQGDSRGVEARYGGFFDDTCYLTAEDGRVLTVEQYDVKRAEVDVTLRDSEG